ncbi:DUF1232 domain-containing protein [Cryobacterium algoritolerans]|uniref:DUF1232 domain-containing protein n=1 Tax=Cryobacterium algoritolerans TaxID=1259184 RepID=A0A4R8WLM3_9MICO|nr:DUF1232 domain-containing protein [Cryobacterium algoritolerans]
MPGPDWWAVVLGIAGGVLLLWLLLVCLLWWAAGKQSDPTRLRDALRLIPDVVRLIRRLAADRTVPTVVRVWLVVLLGYLLSPIDLVPDFIPVLLGYADDAIIVAVVLRFVTRRAGVEALERHWPGTPQGLAALRTLAGL